MDIGVLTVVTALLVALTVRAVVRAARAERYLDKRLASAWWAGALIATTLFAGFVEVGHHQRQALASQALQDLTGNPHARADCQRLTESFLSVSAYDGFVYHDNSDVALFKYHICKDLASYASGGHADPTDDQIAAVHLIAHEANHIMLIWNEAEAECNAVQQSHVVAEFLGATSAQARRLQALYYVRIYPFVRADYSSGECREGGAMDLNPDRTEFP